MLYELCQTGATEDQLYVRPRKAQFSQCRSVRRDELSIRDDDSVGKINCGMFTDKNKFPLDDIEFFRHIRQAMKVTH